MNSSRNSFEMMCFSRFIILQRCGYAIFICSKSCKLLMFYRTQNKEDKANNVVKFLSSHNKTYSHSRHIHSDDLLKLGLKIQSLETLDSRAIDDCKDLQDCVLTLHHIYMQTLANSNALKIVENQNANCMMFTVSSN